jgi:hypothetical protein
MIILLMTIAGLGAACLAGPLARREQFTCADLAAAASGALIGLGMARFLPGAAAGSGLAVPLLFTCGVTAGIAALRQHSFPGG